MGRIKKSDFLFCIACVLFLLSVLIDETAWMAEEVGDKLLVITKLMRYCSYVICCVKIAIGRYRYKTVFIGIVLCLIFLLSWLGCNNRSMIFSLLLYFTAYDVESRQGLRIVCVTQTIFLLLLVLLSMCGYATDYIFDPQTRNRHSLGFSWTTTAPILYFFILLGYIYLKQEKIKISEYILLELVNIWFYKMTDTRMTFVVSSLFLLFFAIEGVFKNRWSFWRYFNKIYCILPTCICIFSLILHWSYNPEKEVWRNLNDLLSGRLALGKSAILKYGVSLFGQKITWIGFSLKRDNIYNASGYNYVDCSYLQILLQFGILFLIAVLGIYTVAVYRAVNQGDYYLVWVLLLVLLFGITEPKLMFFTFNPFPMIAFFRLSKSKTRMKIKQGMLY